MQWLRPQKSLFVFVLFREEITVVFVKWVSCSFLGIHSEF